MTDFITNTLQLALIAAPWLVLGLVVAGLVRAWLPARTIGRSLGGGGMAPVVRAAIIGAPLPLCSCGVLPAAFGLRQAGASKASTTSFLVATPETGVDSIVLSWVLLGPYLAIARPVSAILSAIASGVLVGRVENEQRRGTDAGAITTDELFAAEHQQESAELVGGRHGDDADREPATPGRRTVAGLRYAFTDLLDDIALWLAVGLVIAGVAMTLVPPDVLSSWGSGPLAMLLILVLSVPMYVCATAATPIAHAMLFAGISPGAVLVFLLAGPATNIAGIALIRRMLGKRALVAYLAGVCASAVLLGLLVDAGWAYFGLSVVTGPMLEHTPGHTLPLWLTLPCLVLLTIFALRPIRARILEDRSEPARSESQRRG